MTRPFLLMALLLVAGLPGLSAQTRVLNGVVAIVNDAVITYKDVQNRIAPDLQFLERLYARQPAVLDEKIRELEQRHIEELVEEKLILHEFKTAGYQLPESYLEDKVQEDIKTYGDRLTLTKTLQAQGLTYENYRTKTRERIILRLMWQQHVPQDPLISPYKIETFYKNNQDQFKVGDQIKLRMIIVTNRPNDTLFSAKRMAEEIRSKIQEGATFAEMARIYSSGSQSVEGGDWGWIDKSILRADLAEKAFALKTGQLSEVVEAPDGAYLMLLEERRATHIKPLADVREEIEATLKAEENKRLRKKWIDRLKAKSFVRYF